MTITGRLPGRTSDAVPSSPREQAWATTVAIVLIGLSLVWAIGLHAGSATGPAMSDYGPVLTFVQLLSTLLIVWRARIAGDRGATVLAGLFVYTTPIVAIFAQSYFSTEALYREVAAAWLWQSWRIAVPLAFLTYALTANRRGNVRVALLLGGSCSAAVIALISARELPPLAQNGSVTLAGFIGNGIALAIAIAALVAMSRLRPFTSLDTWVNVLLVTLTARAFLVAQIPVGLRFAPDAAWIFIGMASNLVISVPVVHDLVRLLEVRIASEARREGETDLLGGLKQAFLPPLLPAIDGIRFDAAYRPAEEHLGGDWYDVFPLPDRRVVVVVGDVAGMGVQAALEMVALRESLRASAGIADARSASIAGEAIRQFRPAEPERFASVVVAIYDPPSAHLDYTCLGHPAPLLVRDGTTALLAQAVNPPLGVTRDPVQSGETTLAVGDRVIFYTDGLLEAHHDPIAGEAQLRALAQRKPSAHDLLAAIVGGTRTDDCAILQLAVVATAAQRSWFFESDDAASATEARHSFAAYLAHRGMLADARFDAELVFGELTGNVVRHAPGPIEVALDWQGERAILTVRDRGAAFHANAVDLPDDPLAENHRGLYIISRIAETPAVRRRAGGGNEVAVTLRTGT